METESAEQHVLVVDDDRGNGLLATKALENNGYRVSRVESGEAALEACQNELPDMVVLDVIMPGIDGFETCKQLRQIEGAGQLPVLIATGLDDKESIVKAFEVGATDFITKPIVWELLPHRVQYILRHAATVQSLSHQKEESAALIDALPDMIIRVSPSLIIKDLRGLEKLLVSLGPESSYIGQSLNTILPDDVVKSLEYPMQRVTLDGISQNLQISMEVDTILRDCEVRVTRCGDNECLIIMRDVSDSRMAEDQIQFLVDHDYLTQLPNRRLFYDRLEQAINRAAREELKVAVLFVDLDGFQQINETYGHDMGDTLLQSVSKRLQSVLRKSDSFMWHKANLSTSMARFAGDEFTLLLCGDLAPSHIAKVARRIQRQLQEPLVHEGQSVTVSASIGVSVYPDDGGQSEALFSMAEKATRTAKEQGGNHYHFYQPEMNAQALARLTLESNLRKALDSDQFILYFQPQADLASGKVQMVECLIRWQHPELGMVMPMEFLPIAEESGLIVQLDRWVIEAACAQYDQWRQDGVNVVPMCINVSGHWLSEPGVVDIVLKALADHDVPASAIVLEFSEQAVLDNGEQVYKTIDALNEQGVCVSIDNFGVGYSSLGLLQKIPVTSLKIDKSLVHQLPDQPDAVELVSAVVAMGQRLNLRVIAECVESAPQLAHLRHVKCHAVQGHILSPPMDANRVVYVLNAGELAVV